MEDMTNTVIDNQENNSGFDERPIYDRSYDDYDQRPSVVDERPAESESKFGPAELFVFITSVIGTVGTIVLGFLGIKKLVDKKNNPEDNGDDYEDERPRKKSKKKASKKSSTSKKKAKRRPEPEDEDYDEDYDDSEDDESEDE